MENPEEGAMSWGRTHDGKVLDARLGRLTNAEYRGYDALVCYLLRENRDQGTFHPDEINGAVYLTPNGPKHVTKRHLDKLIQVGAVENSDEPAKPLTIHNWHLWNPTRDVTAADRQRRHRARNSHDMSRVTNAVTVTRDSHEETVTRARRRPRSSPVLKDLNPPTQYVREEPRDARAVEAADSPPGLQGREPAGGVETTAETKPDPISFESQGRLSVAEEVERLRRGMF